MEIKHPLIFLGYCVDSEIARQLTGVSIAGNNMQLKILKYLYESANFKLHCFTVYPVAAFPKDARCYYPKMVIPMLDALSSLRVPFMNFPVIKQISQVLSLYLNVNALLRRYPNAIIFTFNIYPQVGLPACWLRKKYPECTLVTLLADLPIDDNPNRRMPDKFFRDIFNRLTEQSIRKTDKLVVLNKNVVNIYASDKPYIVMEGGVDAQDVATDTMPTANREKIIVYSGTLIEYNGVMELIDAMDLVTCDEVKLHIYGDGLLKEKVVSRLKQTDKVKYMGCVDNQTMRRIQMTAYFLINPRPVDNPISMVTFPSKIFEYLASGSPVLTTRLNGFSEEYFDNMFFVETNRPEEMAKKIDEIMSMPTDALDKMAQRARNFVLNEKNWDKQMEKAIGFILGN